jgi:superfamily II DNA or RNA helicase
MKRARAHLAQDQVLSSHWAPPLLRGVVRAGGTSFRASMVIQNEIDIENLCTCRDARETGQICAHSVAVGLHWLAAQRQPAPEKSKPAQSGSNPHAVKIPPPGPCLRLDPQGEPCELRVILPPSLDRALQAGRIMLVFEASRDGGRSPLNTLDRDRSWAFSEQDQRLLEHIGRLTHGALPAMIQISTEQFAALLPGLADHPRITLGRSEPVSVSTTPLSVPLSATLESNGEILLEPLSKLSGVALAGGWAYANHSFQPIPLAPSLLTALAGPTRIPRSQIPAFISTQWPALSPHARANFRVEDFELDPRPPRFILELSGGMAQISALLQCAYGARIITPGVSSSAEDIWLPDPSSPTRYSTRDIACEQAALSRLRRSGFIGPDQRGRLQLNGQNTVLSFFARDYPRLQKEWSVTLEERLDRSARQNIERIEPRFTVTPSGAQWFDLGVVFSSSSGQRFSQSDIQRLLLSGQGHVRLANGKTALFDAENLDELEQVLRDCAPRQHEQGYRINNTHAAFVESTIREQAGWNMQAPPSWRSGAPGQSGAARPAPLALGALDSVLRPYQKAGVEWLMSLRANGFGGILADEMGLGKTLQTLAFFRSLRSMSNSAPMLVVCPTSLVYNWVSEAAKFAPTLKTLAMRGTDRHSLFAGIPSHDLVVTSYALIRRDAERYREFEFDLLALDEAQHIKNRQTQNAQSVKAIRARQRVVLTGTPIENSVLDLWSIFDFLMPGFLGTADDFRERYEIPITRDKDPRAQARLARRLRPFLLRRTKREVAPELPEKIQQVAYCEMTADQRAVYEQILEATRKEVLDACDALGLARSRMVVLTALLRLRQACCDLRLLKLENVRPETSSAKLDLFSELIEEVLDGGHRALVFSQFTSMLALLREQLDRESIRYCQLDGSTKDRSAVVESFQRDSSIPVFLISLKAGGVGLNLTGADTVIHYDPWWNPAVEDQATDRAHRIGQTRVVTSYKLITRGTIEEKILVLQQRKRELIDAMMAGEEQFASALTWEEIQELLA